MSAPWEKYKNSDGPWNKYKETPPKSSSITLQQAIGPGNEANARNFAMASGDPRAVVGAQSDPVVNLKALPFILGTAGGISPVPGGATIGTVGGRQLSNVALRMMGKPEEIPSNTSQALEGAGALLGDVMAIPYVKGKIFGGRIGDAEKAAGVITRAPTKAVTPGSVGETLNTLEAQIDAGTINTAQGAKDAKAVISQIYKNPKIYEQTGEISVQAQRVSDKVQNLLNKMISGRQAPAEEMAKANLLKNLVMKGYRKMPWPLRVGAQGAMGALGVKKITDLFGSQ